MASDWNRLFDRLARAALTGDEFRLAHAIARETLGYRQRRRGIGKRYLRDTYGFDGRSLERAREGLIAKGYLAFEPGEPGRGRRATYELLLEPGSAAPARPFAERAKCRETGPESAAPARLQIGRKGKENSGEREHATLQSRVATAYMAAGGSLELDEWRGILARQATNAQRRGIAELSILGAAAALGRSREFPGYLTQRAERFAADGGPCSWEGLPRRGLTPKQLAECLCRRCAEWRAHLLARATA